jgi:hypothetical protein
VPSGLSAGYLGPHVLQTVFRLFKSVQQNPLEKSRGALGCDCQQRTFDCLSVGTIIPSRKTNLQNVVVPCSFFVVLFYPITLFDIRFFL